MDTTQIRLTETVAKGGCAAKLPAGQLRAVLAGLQLPKPPALAVGTENLDDACLWDLGNGHYLIQTLDFFTPIVDDPWDFGVIAAANAMSDIFAMGGRPKIALTILAFPTKTLPIEILERLMGGALSAISQAGACLAGGHTIDDDTLKFGFSVSGFVEKDRAWTNAAAKPGDKLILTKGLGTGTIASALKSRKADPTWIESAILSMKTLNDTTDLIDGTHVHAATDITGFGLAGHSLQMAQASDVTFVISSSKLPILLGAWECLEQNILNRAHHTNAEYVKEWVSYQSVPELFRWLTVDPQTSGGLLLSVSESEAEGVLSKLRRKFPMSAVIGEVRRRACATEPRVFFTE